VDNNNNASHFPQQHRISNATKRLVGDSNIQSLLSNALALELNACSNLQKTRIKMGTAQADI
jgi:hypothetical protein